MVNGMEEQEQRLCISCGLCCDGSLFAWVKLRPAELSAALAAGLLVYGDHPADRGFAQPCAVFTGKCGIYDSGFYPKGCLAYRCALLKRYAAGSITVDEATRIIGEVRRAAVDLRVRLPHRSEGERGSANKFIPPGKALREALADLTVAQFDDLPEETKRAVIQYLRSLKEHFGVSRINSDLTGGMD